MRLELKLELVISFILLGISLIFTSLTKLVDIVDEFYPRYISSYIKLAIITGTLVTGLITLLMGVKYLRETLIAEGIVQRNKEQD